MVAPVVMAWFDQVCDSDTKEYHHLDVVPSLAALVNVYLFTVASHLSQLQTPEVGIGM